MAKLVPVRENGKVVMKTRAEVDRMFDGFLSRLEESGCQVIRSDAPDKLAETLGLKK